MIPRRYFDGKKQSLVYLGFPWGPVVERLPLGLTQERDWLYTPSEVPSPDRVSVWSNLKRISSRILGVWLLGRPVWAPERV